MLRWLSLLALAACYRGSDPAAPSSAAAVAASPEATAQAAARTFAEGVATADAGKLRAMFGSSVGVIGLRLESKTCYDTFVEARNYNAAELDSLASCLPELRRHITLDTPANVARDFRGDWTATLTTECWSYELTFTARTEQTLALRSIAATNRCPAPAGSENLGGLTGPRPPLPPPARK